MSLIPPRALLLLLSASIGCASPASAEPRVLVASQHPSVTVAPATTLDLAACQHLALERQPRVAAQRASLAAAEDAYRALEALHVPALVVPDLPIRRRQAALGVTAACAGVEQAERDAIYAATRSYFTVLYAREQERVANAIVDQLTATHDAAQKALDAGARDISARDVQRASVYQSLARTKQIQANQGVKRALAALAEAIGLGCGAELDVPATRLPTVTVRPSRDEVVALAKARRGELVRAGVFAEVTCLEVEAQGTGVHKRLETFAAGADIHAALVPPPVRDTEYRPGGIAPEMPSLLVGSRSNRVKRAESLNERAMAVVDMTRNLIVLEAEDAFLRWEETARQTPEAEEAANSGDRLAAELNKDFTSGLKVKVEEVVSARVLASQARSQYNEYLYRQIVALADLERITGGAFRAGLVEASAAASPSSSGKQNANR